MTKKPADVLEEHLPKIYRSEDLNTSIRILYSFFQDYFPLDFLNILGYDSEQHTLQYRVHATDKSIILMDELIRFSDDTKKEALDIIRRNVNLYIPNGMKHPLVSQFDSQVGINQPASIILHQMGIAHHQYALLCLVVWEEDQYCRKDVKLMNELSQPVDNAIRHIYSQMVISRMRECLASDNREARNRMVLNSSDGTPGLRNVMSRINQVAKLDTPVLLMGETGVGKELMANTIHSSSRRSRGPLISINCGAIAETLLDSELFGHEKGSFTGAGTRTVGLFEQADGGTIFLDEISELSKQAQVKLLRVLQSMSFHRVGGARAISVDVRVITATNRDLEKMIENKEFRKDLWFRLNTFPITIPPLRQRKEDIPVLAEYFARRLSVEMNLPFRYRFANNAMDQLQRYDWPGNVRELENVIEKELILSHGAPLSFPHLSAALPDASSASSGEGHTQALTMNEIMRNHIISVLKLADGKIEGRGGAAEILDMKRSTLRARMKKLGIRIEKNYRT